MFRTLDPPSDEPIEFHRGNCVRSRLHGLGQVLVSGPMPLVQLLGGSRVQVPAADLTLIANEDFAETIANQERIEKWLLKRVYGADALECYSRPARRQEPDGIWTDKPVALPDPRSSPEVDHVFLADDIGQDARVLTDEEAKGRTDVMKCTVTRVSSD
jgi:hypothetical protein